MKKKLISVLLVLCTILSFAPMLAFSSSAASGSVSITGIGEVAYTNATVTTLGNDTLFVFKDSSNAGSITVPADVSAWVLVVGGGGGSGSGGTNWICGDGGNGGAVFEEKAMFISEGAHTVTVGAGGAGGVKGGAKGSSGKASSIANVEGAYAEGGEGGEGNRSSSAENTTPQYTSGIGASGNGTTGIASEITGSSVTYGAGGPVYPTSTTSQKSEAKKSIAADSNTGNGGKAMYWADGVVGSDGGSGIVIVRISPNKRAYRANLIVKGNDEFSVGQTGYYPGEIVTIDERGYSLKSVKVVKADDSDVTVKTTDNKFEMPAYNINIIYELNVEQYNTIDVNKTVTPKTSADEAKIEVISKTTAKSEFSYTPKVLVLSALCSQHSMKKSTPFDTVNTIAKEADVDWFFFYDTYTHNTYQNLRGSVKAGNKIGYNADGSTVSYVGDQLAVTQPVYNQDGSFNSWTYLHWESENHGVLADFLDTLFNKLCKEKKTYDYIVLLFDGNRIEANYDHHKSTHENSVANALVSYYANDQVIWITESGTYSENVNSPVNDDYFRPCSYTYHGDEIMISDSKYKSMLSLLDPENYLKSESSISYVEKRTVQSGKYQNYSVYVNTRNPNQVFYNDESGVLSYFVSLMSKRKYQVKLTDKVHDDLTVQSIKYSIAADSSNPIWTTVATWDAKNGVQYTNAEVNKDLGKVKSFSFTENTVTIITEIIKIDALTKLEIDVKDTEGEFFTVKNGVYNTETDMWEFNPNEGKARLAKVNEEGKETGEWGADDVEEPLKVSPTILGYPIFNNKPMSKKSDNNGNYITVYDAKNKECNLAFKDDVLTVVPSIQKGYALKKITVNGTTLNPVNGVFTITMPANDITVDAEFITAPDAVKDSDYYSYLMLYDDIDANFELDNLGNGFDKTKLAIYIDGNLIKTEDITVNTEESYIECVLAEVEPKDIGKDMHIVVGYDNLILKDFSYSVKKYCLAALEETSVTEDLKALCKAVLNYGKYAEDFHNGNTDSTCNAGYTDVLSGVTCSVDTPTQYSVIGYTVSAAVELASKNSLVFYVTTEKEITLDNLLIINNLGEKVDDENITISHTDNVYTIKIKNIYAEKLSRTYTIYLGYMPAFEYSVLNYCADAQTKTDAQFTATVKSLCKAIYYYAMTASAYVER